MSRRIDQVNELIQREVAEFFRRDIEFPRDLFVTVTRVETHPDLRQAKIFVSVLPFVKHAQALQMLTRARGSVQSMLNGKLFMHHVPQIQFLLDPTEEKATAVESILDDLHRKGEV